MTLSLPSARSNARPTLSTAVLPRVRMLRTCLREQLRALALTHFGQTVDGQSMDDQSEAFLPRRGCSAAPEVTAAETAETAVAGAEARLEVADPEALDLADWEALDLEDRVAEVSEAEADGRCTT